MSATTSRPRKIVAAAVAVGAVAVAGLAAAPAQAASMELEGIRTAVTLFPAITAAVVGEGITPSLADGPGNAYIVTPKPTREQTLRVDFPVTGGSADLATVSGTIEHEGGLVFTKGGMSISVADFDIKLSEGMLYATEVNGAPANVPLFKLDLSAPRVSTQGEAIRVGNIGVSLTGVAADALNASLGTTLFAEDLALGKAVTYLKS